MTQQFASIELARLYEAQGYIEDALSMYRGLDDDVLEGGAEVRAAVKRLELALLKQEENLEDEGTAETPAAPEEVIASALAALEDEPEDESAVFVPRTHEEEAVAQLVEKWLALMVVRKRLQLFKRIRARV